MFVFIKEVRKNMRNVSGFGINEFLKLIFARRKEENRFDWIGVEKEFVS